MPLSLSEILSEIYQLLENIILLENSTISAHEPINTPAYAIQDKHILQLWLGSLHLLFCFGKGTRVSTQFPCPAGTYSTSLGNGKMEDCLACPRGAYCPEGTAKPTLCPP